MFSLDMWNHKTVQLFAAEAIRNLWLMTSALSLLFLSCGLNLRVLGRIFYFWIATNPLSHFKSTEFNIKFFTYAIMATCSYKAYPLETKSLRLDGWNVSDILITAYTLFVKFRYAYKSALTKFWYISLYTRFLSCLKSSWCFE